MKKTTKRFSLGMKIASILTCLVVTAVGFASWIIIKPAEARTKDGSFSVYEVETHGIDIVVTPVKADIVFGRDGTPANPWLTAEGVSPEAMTATFSVSVSATSTDGTTNINTMSSSVKVTFDIASAYTAKFDAALGDCLANPIVNIKQADAVIATATYDKSTGLATATLTGEALNVSTLEFTVEIVFDWGTVTGGENRFTYFNGLEPTADNIQAAQNMLSTIYAITGQEGQVDSAFTLEVASVAATN